MRKVEIGISVYPEFDDLKKMKVQLERAAKLGYNRLFTSMQLSALGFENSHFDVKLFKELFDFAHEFKFVTHADINKEVFESLGATVSNVKVIKDLGVDVLRLDGGFGVSEIIELTRNPFQLIIEDNPFDDETTYEKAERILDEGNPLNYRFCHNFFPRNNTGLDFDETEVLSTYLNDLGYGVGIFMTSQTSPAILNPSGQGIPSIEEHRYLPPETAFSELRNTDVYDVVFFGDSDPSLRDLEAVSSIASKDYVELDVWLNQDLSDQQRKVILETLHHNRLDVSKQVIRSTQTSKRFEVPVSIRLPLVRGMITLDNVLSNRYEGELQIILEDLGYNPVANFAGMVMPHCKRLLEQVKYKQVLFKLKER
jgi:hypothetical protein